MDKGWISVHRKILKNPIVKPTGVYSRFEVWMYLLFRATYTNQKVVLGNDIYHLKEGEIITSQEKLRLLFMWGNTKLRNYLKLLEKDGSIQVKTNKKLTMITILNFKELQNLQITNKSQTNDKQIYINKDINKNNKEPLKVRFKDFLKKCEKELPDDHPEYEPFVNWWSEYNEGGSKMHWEKKKTFNLKMRWATWIRKSKNPETKKISLDKKYPPDKTGNARKCTCTQCGKTDFIELFNPNEKHKSYCCKAPITHWKGNNG